MKFVIRKEILSMMDPNLKALLTLQEADIRRKGMESRLVLLPKEMDAIIARRDKLNAENAAALEAVKKEELAIKKSESEIEQLTEKSRKLQQQSAQVKKNNEYQAMMAEIADNKDKISAIEEELLGRFDHLEELKTAAEICRKQNSGKMRAAREEFEELLAFSKSVKVEIEKLVSERPRLTSAIPDDLLSTYERLLKSKDGSAPIAQVDNDCCGNCHMSVTVATLNELSKGKIAHCDNCQHLLYTE